MTLKKDEINVLWTDRNKPIKTNKVRRRYRMIRYGPLSGLRNLPEHLTTILTVSGSFSFNFSIRVTRVKCAAAALSEITPSILETTVLKSSPNKSSNHLRIISASSTALQIFSLKEQKIKTYYRLSSEFQNLE